MARIEFAALAGRGKIKKHLAEGASRAELCKRMLHHSVHRCNGKYHVWPCIRLGNAASPQPTAIPRKTLKHLRLLVGIPPKQLYPLTNIQTKMSHESDLKLGVAMFRTTS